MIPLPTNTPPLLPPYPLPTMTPSPYPINVVELVGMSTREANFELWVGLLAVCVVLLVIAWVVVALTRIDS